MSFRWVVAFAFSASLVFASFPAQAAAGDTYWTHIYAGSAGKLDTIAGIAVDPTRPSLVWVLGTSVGADTHTDIVTMALDASTGSAVWVRRYDGRAHGRDRAVAISATFGMVVVTGSSQTRVGSRATHTVTIAYVGQTGQHMWTDRFSTASGEEQRPIDLEGVDDGRFYVLVGGTPHGQVVEYDYTGTQKWHAPVTTSTLANLVTLEEQAGHLIAVGNLVTANGSAYLTTRLNELDGAVEWSKRYNGASDAGAKATDAVVSGTLVYVTGIATDGAAEAITTIGYGTQNGKRGRLTTIPAQAPGNADADPHVAGTADGTYLVLSASSELDGVGTFLTKEYGADGSVSWTSRLNGPNDSGSVQAVTLDANGDVAVTGSGTTTASAPGPLSVGYDALGTSTFTASIAPVTHDDVGRVTVFDGSASHVLVGSNWGDDLRVDSYTLS